MAFDELNPEEMVDDLVTTLTDLDMMRYGDEARGERMRTWYAMRQTQLSAELEQYRYLPDEQGNCADGMILCGDGGCGTPEACEGRRCHVGATFCESTNSCYYPEYGDYCPECTEEAPYYCRLNESCVADQQACNDVCAEQGEGYVWCEPVQECIPSFYCDQYGGGGGGRGFPDSLASSSAHPGNSRTLRKSSLVAASVTTSIAARRFNITSASCGRPLRLCARASSVIASGSFFGDRVSTFQARSWNWS